MNLLLLSDARFLTRSAHIVVMGHNIYYYLDPGTKRKHFSIPVMNINYLIVNFQEQIRQLNDSATGCSKRSQVVIRIKTFKHLHYFNCIKLSFAKQKKLSSFSKHFLEHCFKQKYPSYNFTYETNTTLQNRNINTRVLKQLA